MEMKKCEFCQQELEENVNICPNCGKSIAQQETSAEAVAAEVEAAEPVEAAELVETAEPAESAETVETVDAAEEASREAAEETIQTSEVKKATPGKIAAAVAAVVVLAAVLIALIASGMGGQKQETAQVTQPTVMESAEETVPATVPADGNPENETCKGTYTVSDEEALAAKDVVVATIGENQLTNGQLQVFYWSMVNNYLGSEYGYYMMMYGALDYTKPLDTQISFEDQSLTWQQYFLKEALNSWQMALSLAGEAEKAGFGISQADQEYLNNLPASLEETAASYSMTLDELMLNNIGPGAGVQEFIDFQTLYAEGKDYYQQKLLDMKPTQEQLEAFFEQHEADYAASGLTRDSKYVDVRHILVKVEGGSADATGAMTYSDEEWAACEAEAQAILDRWLEGEKTEESFAALANEASEDPGSNTKGGLYENVYMGQMVAPFEQWCFDEARAYGDYGLVKTSYGYHVMFYVGSEPMWVSYAESDWVTEQTNAMMAQLSADYPMDVAYENIKLGYIKLG